MPSIKKNRQTYNQARFRRILSSKLNNLSNSKESKSSSRTTLKKDNCDLLIYLIYVNYVNELMSKAGDPNNGAGEEGEPTLERLESVNDELSKKYRG